MMNKPHYISSLNKAAVILLTSVLLQCQEQEMRPVGEADPAISAMSVVSPESCAQCTYTVPSSSGTQVVDGAALNLSPGSVICLNALNSYSNIVFRNIIGTGADPIIITNCGGDVTLNAAGKPFTMKTEYSKFFRIKGGTGSSYGIKLTGGHMGLTLERLSTNFEVNNIEVYNVGFAGIMAKTDPTCDDETIRGNFVMKNVSIHDNYVHDTGGEGLYIGNSFYEKGMLRECGYRLPHTIDGLKIYNNVIDRSGWEGIQVGCAINGAVVYRNRVENYGYVNKQYQNNGIQFSQGSKGICYQNYINGGPGMGINVVGHGESILHNNVIVNAGTFGIFCDERNSIDLAGYQILNNTIINPGQDGIRMYNEYVPGVVSNNIIVNPGNATYYVYPRSSVDSYVYKLNKDIPLEISNNIFTDNIGDPGFRDHQNFNYRLRDDSPARDAGRDVTGFDISRDHYGNPRLKGSKIDIGASEYQ